MAKFYTIDPNTCSKEELEAAIKDCSDKVDYYACLEQGCKRFINSVYGALASKYYQCTNVDIAESITLQGQDLIKFSVRCMNDFFKKNWNLQEAGHKLIANDMKKLYPDFDEREFLEKCKLPVRFGDTCQVYGDSCTPDTLIEVEYGNGNTQSISVEELFESYSDTKEVLRGKEFISPCGIKVRRMSNDWKLVYGTPSHIIRHKTDKDIYEIRAGINTVKVTEDHSVYVLVGLNGFAESGIKEVSPKDLKEGDKIISHLQHDPVLCYDVVSSVKLVGKTEDYVYDIEMENAEELEHSFFGNGILLHNTDSISDNSIIRTEKHPEGITIKEFYEENSANVGETTLKGHESVHTSDKVLNWNGKLYMGDVERIIRHKVTKPMWKLKAKSGKEVICTCDHSLVIFREGKQLHVKPSEVGCEDTILNNEGLFEAIEYCECIGEYSEEYVYDIEMNDDTHTFFANDVLVHNSAYLTLQPLIDVLGIPMERSVDFILSFNKHLMSPYLDYCFERYAKAFNCPKNLENFELEKIARSLLMIKKKKYVMDISWKEPDVHVKPLHSITFKGVEIIKGTSSLFCRTEQKNFVIWLMDKINKGENIRYSEIVSKIKDIKSRFELQNPNDISETMSISDYEKYVYNDKGTTVIYNDNVVVPFHAKAAAKYNNMLYTKYQKYRSKYPMIHKGDKVKIYYIKNGTEGDDRFAFIPNNFPIEFAPPIDMDEQFKKLILDPLNRYIEAMGETPVSNNFTYTNALY